MVGVRGFEPPAPASRTQCSTRLSYTPTLARNGVAPAQGPAIYRPGSGCASGAWRFVRRGLGGRRMGLKPRQGPHPRGRMSAFAEGVLSPRARSAPSALSPRIIKAGAAASLLAWGEGQDEGLAAAWELAGWRADGVRFAAPQVVKTVHPSVCFVKPGPKSLTTRDDSVRPNARLFRGLWLSGRAGCRNRPPRSGRASRRSP